MEARLVLAAMNDRLLQSKSLPNLTVSPRSNSRSWRVAALLYVALVVYGSLYPLTGWTVPSEPLFSFLTAPVASYDSRADVLTNILAYIPLGILLVWSFPTRRRVLIVTAATLAGGLLSLTMESVQMFLPSRTSSKIDLLTNLMGTLVGAIAGSVFRSDSVVTLHLRSTRDAWFETQEGANVGLCAVLLWGLSQLSPFVPSMDVSSIREGLSPLWQTLNDPSSLSLLRTFSYSLDITGMGLLMTVVTRRGRKITLPFLLAVGFVLFLKPLIVSRQLGLEPICGLALAGLLLVVTPKPKGLRALLAMFSIFAGFAMAEMTPATGGFHPFNWIPFAGQIDNTVKGFGSILEGTWPFVALAALAILGFGIKRKPMMYIGSILLILVFGFEWVQQGIPGRYADITVVILAAVGWIFPWFYVAMSRKPRLDYAVRRDRGQLRTPRSLDPRAGLDDRLAQQDARPR